MRRNYRHPADNIALNRGAAAGNQFGSWIALRRLLGPLLLLLLLSASLGHGPSYGYADPTSGATLTAATLPSDGPCNSPHGTDHRHGICGLSAFCAPFAPIEVASDPTHEQAVGIVADADSPHRSNESAPPFHPPKHSVAG